MMKYSTCHSIDTLVKNTLHAFYSLILQTRVRMLLLMYQPALASYLYYIGTYQTHVLRIFFMALMRWKQGQDFAIFFKESTKHAQ